MIKSVFLTASLISGGLFAYTALAQVPVVDRSGEQQVPVTDTNPPVAPVSAPETPVAVPAVGPVTRPNAVVAAPNATAELLLMVEQLQEEVGYLRGQLEQQQYQLKRMKEDQRDRYRDLDRRLSLLNRSEAPVSAVPQSGLPAALPDSPVASLAQPSPAVDQAPAVAVSQPALTDAQAYKQAFAMVRSREFDQALLAFDQFLVNYPNSSLRANVYYWSGEVYRVKSTPDFAKSAEAYQLVVNRYPDHSKAADAHYKLGIAQQGLGQLDQAKSTMAKVVELYPNQAAAKLAQDFLSQHR